MLHTGKKNVLLFSSTESSPLLSTYQENPFLTLHWWEIQLDLTHDTFIKHIKLNKLYFTRILLCFKEVIIFLERFFFSSNFQGALLSLYYILSFLVFSSPLEEVGARYMNPFSSWVACFWIWERRKKKKRKEKEGITCFTF